MQRHKKRVLAAEEIRRCQKFGQVRIIRIQWLFPSFCLTCQMLIARLAPTVHVHLLKHGGIASKGHCIAFPQAVQQPATTLPRLPAEVDIICMRRQGKDDTHKDLGLEDTVLKEPFVGSRTTILLMVMLLMMAPA